VTLNSQPNLARSVPHLTDARLFRVLHLSHTDVRVDGRILKETSALSAEGLGYQVAVGIDRPDGAVASPPVSGVLLLALPSLARRLKGFRLCPAWIRYVAGFIDISVRMAIIGLRCRPTVVHCHDVGFLHVGVFLRLVVGSKVVYDAHELESARNGDGKILSFCILAVERLLWPAVDQFVSVSPGIIEWYRSRFGPKPSCLIMNAPDIRSGVGSASAPSPDRYLHHKYGIPPNSTVCVYVGLFCKGRGIEVFAEAVKRIGDPVHFILLGFGEYLDLRTLVGKAQNIHVHPPVSHDRVVEIIRSADIGVCLVEDISLSDHLCLPNKLFEYAFAGVPLLASRLPEIAKVVGDYGLGVCCDNDANSIEAALRRIRREGLEPPRGDLAELSWETQAKRLQEAYRTLLAERRLAATGTKGEL